MNREHAVQIRPNDDQYDNADLITLLYHMTSPVDIVFNEVPEIKKDSIFFIESNRVVKELFQFSDCFDWINGGVHLWTNEKPLTRFNYRTKIWDVKPTEDKEGEFHYEYLPLSEITDIPPITEEAPTI